MKSASRVTLLMILLSFVACAGFAEKSRMESFSHIFDAYEQALRMGNYDAAAKFLDPVSLHGTTPDIDKYQNIKVFDIKVTNVKVSDDGFEIKQDAELQYFLLNSNRLRTLRQAQTWRYKPDQEIWLLESGLPKF